MQSSKVRQEVAGKFLLSTKEAALTDYIFSFD